MNPHSVEGGKGLLAVERVQLLRHRLVEDGSIRVSEAVDILGVSGETVRRYLKVLADEPGIRLVRGGAVMEEAAGPQALGILPVMERTGVRPAEKRAIGERAAALVADGAAVVLDGGTTTLAVARALVRHNRLTILTNNLMIANVVAQYPGVRIFVLGGKLVPESMCVVGPRVEEQLLGMSVDWAFLGAAGISVQKGFTSADPFESELKRAFIRISRRAVVVADGSKMATSGFDTFAEPGEVDTFITCGSPDPETEAYFESKGLTILRAETGAG